MNIFAIHVVPRKNTCKRLVMHPLRLVRFAGVAITKLISAAGFQLKGGGWYVTDFRNNKTKQTDTKSTATDSASATPVAADTVASKESASTPAAD